MMRTRTSKFKRWAAPIALLAIIAVPGALAGPAAASHFRGGDINYQSMGTTGTFERTVTFRCTFFFVSCPAVGSNVSLSGAATLNNTDGTSDPDSNMTVVSSNPAEDNFTARKTSTRTFANSNRRTPDLTGCCTLSSLLNNNDASYRLFTDFNPAVDVNSPKTSVPPIVNVGSSGNQTFLVPATDPGGQTLRWRLATNAESLGFATNPPDYSINSSTGLVTFVTTGKTQGLYHSSVVIEALNGAGAVVSATQTTFLVRIGQGVANQPPQYVAPTPADGTIYTVAPGDNLSIALRASDPDAGDTVDIVPGALPPGATFNDTPANPVNGTFSFTPTAAQDGQDYVVNFTAQDGKGGSVFRSYTIRVRTPVGPSGRMGGKGQLSDTAASSLYSGAANFAYVLACNKASNPISPRQNPLEVRFDKYIYKLSSVTTIGCSTTGGGSPAAGFDTMTGDAAGTLKKPNGTTVGATASFRFYDGGAGPDDRSRIVITDMTGEILNIDGAPGKFPGSSQPTGENTAANP